MPVYLKGKLKLIPKVKSRLGALLFDEDPTVIPVKYYNYSKVFLAKYIAKLLKHTEMNAHTIKLKKGKQQSFGLIYSLASFKLENLKTYIETNLANVFIRLFKSFIEASILFDRKLDENLCLCVNY